MRRAGAALAAVATLLTGAAGAAPPDIITAAEYAGPTTRYAHGVLGDEVEWGALKLTVECSGCDERKLRGVTIRLPENRVFEDIAPRLADLDGDGAPEVIVVETDISMGARLAVYDESGLVAATPFIGQPNRWLAPVGAADLDGDGDTEIAYVDRPHLAKILRVWRFRDRALTPVADLPGLSNHRIGEDFISGGIRDCGAGPEIVTADAAWRRIMVTRLKDGRLTAAPAQAPADPAGFAAVLACR